MSDEESDPESRTEAASQRKLDRLAEEGQIPLGRDVASLGAVAGGVAALAACASRLGPLLVERTRDAASSPLSAPSFEAYAPIGALVFAISAAAAAGAALAMVAQTKGRVWTNLAVPDPSRVWKPERITKLFSREGAADLGVAVLKVVFLALACRWAFTGAYERVLLLLDAPPEALLHAWLSTLWPAVLKLLGAIAVVAAVDLGVSRWKFARDTRMTKEEARREHREDEGDPMLKGRRRKKQRDLAKHRVSVDVPRADAVIVNPTHIAIAIRYRKDEGGAPRVIAKGKGALAEVVRDLARANAIPIVEDIPLARLLYKRVRIGGVIPKETYQAVATVLAHVYRLKTRR